MMEPYFTMSDEQMALFKILTENAPKEKVESLIELLESVREGGWSAGVVAGGAEVLYPDDIRHD